MMEIVTGGSASGKSGYAESKVLSLGMQKRIYIATMQPWDEECRQRIERHRNMRKKKHFETIECYTDLQKLRIRAERPVILLECMSNLVANECFRISGETGGRPETCGNFHEETVGLRIMEGVRNLKSQAGHLIIVTNEVFSDDVAYDLQTELYRRTLGRLNQLLSAMADQVTEVVYGLPVKMKEPDNKNRMRGVYDNIR